MIHCYYTTILIMPNFLINTDKKLSNISDDLINSKILGVDTEFIRESTYYPQLALIQFATKYNNYIVDVTAIKSDGIIKDVLTNDSIVKVLHSARQDLETIHCYFRHFPINIFDTQIAHNLTSSLINPSYSSLVKKYFSVELKEGSWRTDWLKRPLTDEKIEYAANDVNYLINLSHLYQEQLKELGRLDWFKEEQDKELSIKSIVTEPSLAWKKITIPLSLNDNEIDTLKILASWRERTAVTNNIPKKWILTDGELIKFSCAKIDEFHNLSSNIKNRKFFDYKDDLFITISNKKSISDKRKNIDMNTYNKLINKCNETLIQISQDYDLSPSLIANKRDIDYFSRGIKEIKFLRGWRFKIFGKLVQ